MGLDLIYNDGQTPLDEDEIEGLKIKTISTRQEFDELEQNNIEEALLWTLSHSLKAEKILAEEFIKQLHIKMFGDVWQWAGEFRRTNKNIGVDKWQISTELKMLLDDSRYWLKNSTYAPDEFAIRYKHRLVSIHCFPNGNGRHSRLMADVIVEKIFKLDVFSWGANNLIQPGQLRTEYLKAVKAADLGNIEPLLHLARM